MVNPHPNSSASRHLWLVPKYIPGGQDDIEEPDVEDDAEGDEGEVDGEQEPVQLRGDLAVVVHLLHLLQANNMDGKVSQQFPTQALICWNIYPVGKFLLFKWGSGGRFN